MPGPVFREPWEAQAFAMTLALYERGLFTWPEWAATLAEEIKRAQAAGVSQAVFDRGGYRYHGHVRAFAEAIREAGITV